MRDYLQLVRQAVRSLMRAPGFAVTAAVTLSVGIGLSTAVFTVANALLLRSLPVGDQDRIITLWGETSSGWSNLPLNLDQVREFERGSRTLEQMAFWTFRGAVPVPVRQDDRAFQIRTALVSGNFFTMLRSRAVLGRPLEPEDDVPGAAPVIVLSHEAWLRQFGGDPAVVGRSINTILDGRSHTIVGVMPRGLEYPHDVQAWVPIIAFSAAGGSSAATGELDILARLRAGASPADARSELTGFFARPDLPEWQRGARGVVHTLPEIVLGNTRPALFLVLLAAGLLLVIACLNVANLLLVRSLGRFRDLVVRSAMGATRGRLVAQQLTENALVSLAGGLLGLGVAAASVKVFLGFAPASIPRLDEIGFDWTVLGMGISVTVLATLLTGLVPPLFGSQVNGQDALRSGSRQTVGPRVRLATEALVVTQVALAVLSLSAAGLMTRSLIRLWRVDLSFDSRNLLVAELAVQQDRFEDPAGAHTALNLLQARLEALPGVEAVAPVLNVPFVAGGGGIDGPLALPGQGRDETARNPVVNMEVVTPGYFATLRIPVHGRAFSKEDREGAPPVVILSSSVVRHFWPNEDALGRQIQGPGGGNVTIVGIVPDTRYRELERARPSVYFPMQQGAFGSIVPMTLLIRTSHSPGEAVAPVRRAALDANLGFTVLSAEPFDALLEGPRAQPRLHAIVLGGFALAAVTLAAIGLFAITMTMLRQRTRELAVRMALGATPGAVGRLVLLRGVGLAAIGTAIGVGSSFGLSRLLAAVLYEVRPTDSATLTAVTGVMIALAAVASYVPARAGMRIHPVDSLRSEG